MLNHRRNNVFNVVAGKMAPAAAYRVVVYPIGAIAASSGSSNIHPVRAGHSLKVGNYVMVGTDNSVVRRVSAVTQTSYTAVPAHAASEGDKIVNLGDDPTAAWTGSTVKIYNEPSGAGTPRSNSQIDTDSNGDYEYWTRGQDVWELILDSTGVPAVVVAGIGMGDGRRNIVDYGAAGDGSEDDSAALTSAVLAGPGTVYLPGGTYLFSSAPATITQTGIILQGDGYDDSIINTSIAAGDAIKVDVEGAGNDGVFTARDIGFVQVTNALTSGSAVVNIEFAAKLTLDTLRVQGTNGTDLMSVGTAIRLSEVNAGWIYDVYLRGEDLYRIGVGMDVCQGVIANRGNITMFGGLYERCTVGVRIANGATQLVNNIQMFGTKLLLSGSGAKSDGVGIDMGEWSDSVSCRGVHIEGYAVGVKGDSVANFAFTDGLVSQFSAGSALGFDFDTACQNVVITDNRLGNSTAAGTVFHLDASAHTNFRLGPNRVNASTYATYITDGTTGTNPGHVYINHPGATAGHHIQDSLEVDGAATINGNLRIVDQLYWGAPTTATISSGTATITSGNVTIAAESGTTDDLDNIGLVAEGAVIFIQAAAGDTITVNDNSVAAGNVRLDADATPGTTFVMNGDDAMQLIGRNGYWVELTRAANG